MKILFLFAIAYILIGCGGKIEYIDRPVEVKVPTQCQVEAPKRPVLIQGFEGSRQLSIYAEDLECVVALCSGKPCKNK